MAPIASGVRCMALAPGVRSNCHGNQVTKNTFFGEFRAYAQEIVDSPKIVRIMPGQERVIKDLAVPKLQTLVAFDKERHG